MRVVYARADIRRARRRSPGREHAVLGATALLFVSWSVGCSTPRAPIAVDAWVVPSDEAAVGHDAALPADAAFDDAYRARPDAAGCVGDFDGDGICGADDCEPYDPAVPRGETITADGRPLDEDCDGRYDEGFEPSIGVLHPIPLAAAPMGAPRDRRADIATVRMAPDRKTLFALRTGVGAAVLAGRRGDSVEAFDDWHEAISFGPARPTSFDFIGPELVFTGALDGNDRPARLYRAVVSAPDRLARTLVRVDEVQVTGAVEPFSDVTAWRDENGSYEIMLSAGARGMRRIYRGTLDERTLIVFPVAFGPPDAYVETYGATRDANGRMWFVTRDAEDEVALHYDERRMVTYPAFALGETTISSPLYVPASRELFVLLDGPSAVGGPGARSLFRAEVCTSGPCAARNDCPSDWVAGPDGRSCYRAIQQAQTPISARATCAAQRSHLVSVMSPAERDVAWNARQGLGRFWTGATDAFVEGEFLWDGLEPFVWMPFGWAGMTAQPDNAGGGSGEDCVALSDGFTLVGVMGSGGQAGDLACAASLPSMCEIDLWPSWPMCLDVEGCHR